MGKSDDELDRTLDGFAKYDLTGKFGEDSRPASCSPYRGSRCGICYWALYDGDCCQNKDCQLHGKSVGENRIRLTNDEAQILIQANSLDMTAKNANVNTPSK